MKFAVLSVAFLTSIAFFSPSSRADAVSGIANNLSLDVITNVGAKVWKVMNEGNVVVNEKTTSANALPKGITDWSQLQGWKVGYLQDSLVIHQLLGGTSLKYDYRLVFTYNGSVNGAGNYIGYATIEKVNLTAKFGAPQLNVWVDVPTVFNMGTSANPVAAMKINLHIETQRVIAGLRLQKSDTVTSFIITGTGQARRL